MNTFIHWHMLRKCVNWNFTYFCGCVSQKWTIKASCRIFYVQYDPIYIKFRNIRKNTTYYLGIQTYSKNGLKYTRMINPKFNLTANSKEGMWLCRRMQISSTMAVFYNLKWMGWRAHWYCCIIIYIQYLPIICFPVLPDRSSILFSYLPIYPLPHFKHPLGPSGRLSHPQ